MWPGEGVKKVGPATQSRQPSAQTIASEVGASVPAFNGVPVSCAVEKINRSVWYQAE